MNTRTLATILLGPASLAPLFTGCAVLQQPAAPTPPTTAAQASYLDVPYAKFVSGLYVDQLKDKYVRIKCTFYSQAAGFLPGGFSPDRYLAFAAGAPAGSTVPSQLTVVVPKEMADIVFAMKFGEAVAVSGRAIEVTVTANNGNSYRSLALEGQKIEKTQ